MRNRKNFTWGKPCRKHNHQKEDGTNLRYFECCVMCEGWSPNYTQDELLAKLSDPTCQPPRPTSEEVRARQVQASMRWNRKNMDKLRGYVQKYNNKPERREIVRLRREEAKRIKRDGK